MTEPGTGPGAPEASDASDADRSCAGVVDEVVDEVADEGVSVALVCTLATIFPLKRIRSDPWRIV